MKPILTALILLFAFPITHDSFLLSQTRFQRAVGGGDVDFGFSVAGTTDGGYALAGYTTSGFGGAMYIVKLDPNGTLQWSRTVGGADEDYAYSIIQTTDGGYMVSGTTRSFGAGGFDFYLVKLNSSGTLQWSKTIGGTNFDFAYSIIQTSDGGYTVAGATGSFGTGGDFYIVKIDSSGTLQWNKTIGGAGSDAATSIVGATDGGYAVAGYTNSFAPPYNDMFIVKLDSSGTLQWSKTVGGTGIDAATSIVRTTDGGYAVAGYTNSFKTPYSDMYIVKLDSGGTLQWGKAVGGASNDQAGSIIQAADGGYAVAGWTFSFGAGAGDFYIVKLDAGGTLQWSKTIGEIGRDEASSIIQTTDGGYVAGGSTWSFGTVGEMYIVKLDAGGTACGNTSSPSSISGTGGTMGSPTPTVTIPNPTVTSPASTTGTVGAVTTVCTTVGVNQEEHQMPSEFRLEQNYPNPFNPSTIITYDLPVSSHVTLTVYDVLGREVQTLVNETQRAGRYSAEFAPSGLTSGVYLYRITAGQFVQTRKLLLLR